MKKVKIFKLFGLILPLAIMTACQKDEEPMNQTPDNSNLSLSILGLEDLGSDYVYEGWLIVDSSPVSSGTFSVDADGALSKTSFSVKTSDLENATQFVLSIEPANDPDPLPAATKILAGDFSGSDAQLTIAPVGDFSAAAGNYILATPTTASMDDEKSGIWFLDPMTPSAGLTLPTLPDGWMYEGWVVIDGTPLSTGKFIDVAATDDSAPYSGSVMLPSPNPDGFFPGEDFVMNAPMGLSFPTDLSGQTAVISIEPFPDNSDAPFALKPLVQVIPSSAEVHQRYAMDQNLNFPNGTVSR